MKIEDIKQLLKSGDVAGAERTTIAELENDKDNVRLLILYGTCRQLQGDEAAFRDAYAAIKAAVDVSDVDLDEVTDREWKRFEMLYKRLDQPELLRKGDRPRSPVLMEYVVLAALIVAAMIGVWIFFGDQIIASLSLQEGSEYHGKLYGAPRDVGLDCYRNASNVEAEWTTSGGPGDGCSTGD